MLTDDRILSGVIELYQSHTQSLAASLANTSSDLERLDIVVTETLVMKSELRSLSLHKCKYPSKHVLKLYQKEKEAYAAVLARVSHLLEDANRIVNNLN